jgi:predicted RNase H-like HicB family nuclease/DNA-binding XRE family transcriptional regulator
MKGSHASFWSEQKRGDMRFAGRVYKHGKFWLAEVPLFDAMTQGRTRREALEMIADWFTSIVEEPSFDVQVISGAGEHIEITSADLPALIRLLLRRRREGSGLSLAQVAQRLGVQSRNAYARYEQGQSVPSLEKLNALLQAVSPETELVVQESAAPYGSRRK